MPEDQDLHVFDGVASHQQSQPAERRTTLRSSRTSSRPGPAVGRTAHAASAVLRAWRGSIPCWRSLRVRVWGATGHAGERAGARVPGVRGSGIARGAARARSRRGASHRQHRRTASRDRYPARTIPIGLDLFYDWSRPQGFRYQHRFSTRSGNDGNNRHVSDNADMRLSAPTPESGAPLPGYMIDISAGQANERPAR
jgi:hypothetical protein